MSLPATLPERPRGWKRQMVMHVNFGRGRGACVYDIFDLEGRKMPIGYAYVSNDEAATGFFLIGREKTSPCMTWSNLRRVWPRFLEKRAQSGGSAA